MATTVLPSLEKPQTEDEGRALAEAIGDALDSDGFFVLGHWWADGTAAVMLRAFAEPQRAAQITTLFDSWEWGALSAKKRAGGNRAEALVARMAAETHAPARIARVPQDVPGATLNETYWLARARGGAAEIVLAAYVRAAERYASVTRWTLASLSDAPHSLGHRYLVGWNGPDITAMVAPMQVWWAEVGA